MNDQNSNEQASGDKGGMLDSIMGSNDKASSGGGQQSGGANSTEDKVLNEGALPTSSSLPNFPTYDIAVCLLRRRLKTGNEDTDRSQ